MNGYSTVIKLIFISNYPEEGDPGRNSDDDTDTEKGAIPAAEVQVNSSGLHVGGKPQVRLAENSLDLKTTKQSSKYAWSAI